MQDSDGKRQLWEISQVLDIKQYLSLDLNKYVYITVHINELFKNRKQNIILR
jgi:hypothetical protein